MKPVSLSTMWLAGRFSHLSDFVTAGLEMGFPWFELNYQVTPEILGDARPGQVPVSSVHHPCPRTLPQESFKAEDIFFSSTDEARRSRAVQLACDTIDFARKFGASTVVLHMGQVNGCAQLERELLRLAQEEGTDAPATLEAWAALVEARAQAQEPHMKAVQRSLRELCEHARRSGIRLGLENRVHHFEIPSLSEMELLLSHYDDGTAGYWHDVGHAEITARLGFYSHLAWLEAFGPRMFGIHLHDVRGFQDHRVAGAGDVDLEMLRPYIPDEALRVCEFNQGQPAEEVRQGLAHLKDLGLVP